MSTLLTTRTAIHLHGDAAPLRRRSAGLIGCMIALASTQPALAQMRIGEFMYSGGSGEFIEFTNTGSTPIDMGGWSFDDDSRVAGTVPLAAFGMVQPGESVVLTEVTDSAFRTAWNLCAAAKVIGNNAAGLGRADEINLYNAAGSLVDRLTFGDQVYAGSIRTQNVSGWVGASGLGANTIASWQLSTPGDGQASIASAQGDIGSPGRNAQAATPFNPCTSPPGMPTVTIDAATTSRSVDLAASGSGAASGVIGDPTDPLASHGIGLRFDDPDGDASLLTITLTSSNTGVVPMAGLVLQGSGALRNLRVLPAGVGRSTITIRAESANGDSGSYTLRYAASAAAAVPANTLFMTGASDASAAIAVGDHVLIADNEDQLLRLYPRNRSGLHQAGFDFTASLGLTDIDDGVPREVDIEAATRVGNRIFWSGSHSNSKDGALRPNRARVFATDITGNGLATTLAYVGRYDFLRVDLRAWDQANGHGLGANALGFVAGTAIDIAPERADGFNIEGLAMAPDNNTAYVAFRAPLLPAGTRNQALIVPVLDFPSLVAGTAPTPRPAGSARFGTPILLDLGGRAFRNLDRNSAGDYVITAGPPAGASGIAPSNFRLFGWNGNPASPPFAINTDANALVTGGSPEALVDVPELLGPTSALQLVSDNGDTVWYADGVIAKDLADKRDAKFRVDRITVDLPSPRDVILLTGFDSR